MWQHADELWKIAGLGLKLIRNQKELLSILQA